MTTAEVLHTGPQLPEPLSVLALVVLAVIAAGLPLGVFTASLNRRKETRR